MHLLLPMTEEVKPKGTPYGMAMAVLQEFAEALPGAIVILPDHVLWQSDSDTLSAHTFQLLDEAAAVLSALHARHIPLALLLPSETIKQVHACLQHTKLLVQFAAVVEYYSQSVPLSPPAQQACHTQSRPQQPHTQHAASGTSSSWMDAAAAVKTQIGVPWQEMLMFCPLAAVDAARLANQLGIACIKVAATGGLTVGSLRQGLETYGSKLESDRGY